jgi:3-methyl-2-oxobutanoate hydroxymethyltransferase
MSTAIREVKKVTTNTLQKMKAAGGKISMITAYDFSLFVPTGFHNSRLK